MSKYTILQMTQQILSAMDSDQVNSINDTPEAMQVALCIQQSYNNMLGRYDLPEHNQLFQLDPSNNNSQPTLMYRPAGVQRIEWIKYYDSNPADSASFQQSQFGAYSHDLNLDLVSHTWLTTSSSSVTIDNSVGTSVVFTVASSTLPVLTNQFVSASSGVNMIFGTVNSYIGTTLNVQVTNVIGSGTLSSWVITSDTGGAAPPGYLDIQILLPEDFFAMIDSFNPSDATVGTFSLTIDSNYTGNPYTFTFNYKNDRQPHYCAIIGNQYVIFDSYDNTQDVTLQQSKTLVYGWVIPQITLTDNFIPVLDDQQFPMLVNEAKSLAFLELKQTQHPKAEQEVMRQLISLQKFKAVSNKPSQFSMLPSFGRRGSGYGGYGSRFTTAR